MKISIAIDFNVSIDKNFLILYTTAYPTNKYMLKVSHRNTRKRCEIYFKVNNKNNQDGVIDIVLVYLLLTLNIFHIFF